MAIESGAISPLSASSTSTLNEKHEEALVDKLAPHSSVSPSTPPNVSLVTSASTIIESLASRHSSSVFIYDTAKQAGVGHLTKVWSSRHNASHVVEMQSRPGSGLIIAGRLGQSSSTHAGKGGILSAYTNPEGLAQMIPTLVSFPVPTAAGRLVVQVPGVSSIRPSLQLTPSLATVSSSLSILPDTFAVILSSTPKESVDLASVSYAASDKHVIHIFDQYASARETRRITYPHLLNGSDTLEKALATAGYSHFDYAGSATASIILVALAGPLGSALGVLARHLPNVGVITVRVLRPWSPEAFNKVVPHSAKVIHVLSDSLHEGSANALFEDVFGASLEREGHAPSIHDHGITPTTLSELIHSPAGLKKFVSRIAGTGAGVLSAHLVPTTLKKLLFVGTPGVPLSTLPDVVAHSFMTHPSIEARLLTDYDAFSQAGGMTVSRLFLTSRDTPEVDELPANIILPFGGEKDQGTTDFVAISDDSLVKTHHVFKASRPHSFVLLFSKWSTEEVLANLPTASLELIREKSLCLYVLNSHATAAELLKPKAREAESRQAMENVLAHLAFLRIYVGTSCTLQSLEKVARGLFGEKVGSVCIPEIVAMLWENILQVKVSPTPTAAEESCPGAQDVESLKPLRSFEINCVELDSTRGAENDGQQFSAMGSIQDAAKHIVFKEAFGLPSTKPSEVDTTDQHPSLRPDLEDRTFLVKCAVNRRLTPTTYDRNVFHLEFDTAGTGLKYEIGEALGVHGWNDEAEVKDFCRWYGLDPDAIVSIPVPASHRPTSRNVPLRHTRTVFQALQQQIDIFGKPPKSFYSSLAEHAKTKPHQMALRFIGAAEGADTLKKLTEVDTVSFAEVLAMFDSARPDFAALCDLVGDIKPRHYSIASAQSAVGDRVDLLVVTVDWVTPSGSPRYGQCTRYLAGLKVGQQVTVSIKPSVMKLPPDNMQPIVMAGLGTGAAPFRAFIQHRAHLAAQKVPIGPLIYYFGSRHRSQEYLYGEELEAYIDGGIITHAGFAFSRDQKKKIYIQHKMLEDGKMLAEMLGELEDASATNRKAKGVFYLCGPTWPVPDVYEALLGALGEYGGYSREAAAEHIENLKEEERYVLEVY
ncbi:hypothetical protein FRB96_001839 [Tulasnella sp. 330]|nr:hypothetical protein FRB96_001839 [Tulasnella sp. 330]